MCDKNKCHGCRSICKFKDLKGHDNKHCVYNIIQCPVSNCGEKLEKNCLKQHLKSVINKASKNKDKKYNPDNPSLIAALKSQDVDAWIKAINAEYEQHGLENTWDAVAYLPKDKPWVPSHLILVRQRLATGEIKKYKARLVANGSKQLFQTFEENSSPTAKESSVKFFYAKSATLGKIIRTFDVKGAYLKSDIDQEIYMLLPKMNNNDTSQYVRLNKSIYGLKQAGKL